MRQTLYVRLITHCRFNLIFSYGNDPELCALNWPKSQVLSYVSDAFLQDAECKRIHDLWCYEICGCKFHSTMRRNRRDGHAVIFFAPV